jgi:FtsP/CotA-like multicopper oxidase with cupredoxin domain
MVCAKKIYHVCDIVWMAVTRAAQAFRVQPDGCRRKSYKPFPELYKPEVRNSPLVCIRNTNTKSSNMKPSTLVYQLTASEFKWKLSDGKTITAWGFNQSVPGPTLRAQKGDTMIVRVKNNLSESTVVHWHGIRLTSSMDGTDSVQRPIAPGEEFEYNFIVPDAGTFWYHSHQNETKQMERGMYGALIVEEESTVVTDQDRVFMIDDMKLTADNEFKSGNSLLRWIERHDGREGDTLLVNGKENFQIEMNADQSERWRFINSSSARYFRLSLGGRKFKQIATDGGLLEYPVELTELMIVPGERAEILVGPFREGESFELESLKYNRMTMLKSKDRKFATISVLGSMPSTFYMPERLRTIQPLAAPDAATSRKVRLSVGPSLKHGIDFLVNGETHADDKPVVAGELQVWEVRNTSLMDHPFHLHGFFFQVLEVNGKAAQYVSWKDTINLKPRSTVKIAWMPDRIGQWMYHCHILEHHEAGMMGHFEVVDRSTQEHQPRHYQN